MKEELMKILPDLKQAVEQGISYGGDLFNRAVEYYLLGNFIWLVIFIFFSIMLFVIGRRKFVKDGLIDEDGDFWNYSPWMLIISSIFLFLAVGTVVDIIQLYIIPEIYILELLIK